jgi:hypothetical protein
MLNNQFSINVNWQLIFVHDYYMVFILKKNCDKE